MQLSDILSKIDLLTSTSGKNISGEVFLLNDMDRIFVEKNCTHDTNCYVVYNHEKVQ